MEENLISQAVDKMKRDSVFMITQIYKNRNVSPFIRDILKDRIKIHKQTFHYLILMRIQFNRKVRIYDFLNIPHTQKDNKNDN